MSKMEREEKKGNRKRRGGRGELGKGEIMPLNLLFLPASGLLEVSFSSVCIVRTTPGQENLIEKVLVSLSLVTHKHTIL